MSPNSNPKLRTQFRTGFNLRPPLIEVDDDFEYEISEILDSKIDKRRKCKLLYLVRWTGYEGTDQEMDWLSATELEHAAELVQDFHKSYPDKPRPLISLH